MLRHILNLHQVLGKHEWYKMELKVPDSSVHGSVKQGLKGHLKLGQSRNTGLSLIPSFLTPPFLKYSTSNTT